jgi:hypothetical protein
VGHVAGVIERHSPGNAHKPGLYSTSTGTQCSDAAV